MSHKIEKFENPKRIEELKPLETLKNVGFESGMVLCDIGAGTGLFTFPATTITREMVYALEISDEMIELLKQRQTERQIDNLCIKKVDSSVLPVDNQVADLALLVTVLHEIEDQDILLTEIKRLLKSTGKLLVIEFFKQVTPMGPPVDHRISQEQVASVCLSNGFHLERDFVCGENLYGMVFKANA